MSENVSAVSSGLRPNPDDYSCDLLYCLTSMVEVRTVVPEDALTAEALGTERSGHGVVIDDQGLVLTIGYIVTEAESVWLIADDGKALPAHVVAYDQQSGFGLVQALGKLDLPALKLGNSSELVPEQSMVVAGSGGLEHCVATEIASIREFAGYWEYLLDDAIFTSPAHPSWGGTALIGDDGKLYGIGSLIVQTLDSTGEKGYANMVIPIDLLPPIIDELMRYGRRDREPRPWLGWFIQETSSGPVVADVVDDGPADVGGIQEGDVITAVNGQGIDSLADLYRKVWASGDAGVEIEISIDRESRYKTLRLGSIDRSSRLKSASLH